MATSVGNPKMQCPLKQVKDPLKSTTDEVTIKCEHRSLSTGKTFFEVVPSDKTLGPYKDKITLNWNGPNKPTKLKVSGIGEVALKGNSFELELSSYFFDKKWQTYKNNVDESTKNLSKAVFITIDFFRQMFTVNHKISFIVHGMPNGSLPIMFYNPEIWEVSFSFPYFKPYKNGDKYEKGKVRQKDRVAYDQALAKKNELEAITKKAKEDAEKAGKKSDELNNVLKIYRSGNPLHLSGFDILNNIFRIVNLCKDIQDLLKSAPKVGWYIDWNVQIFQGTISASWGWKEFTKGAKPSKDPIETNEAVYEVSLEANTKIIEAKIELGVGVSGFSFGVQVFSALMGEISMGVNLTKIAPADDLDVELSGKFEGKITGIGGARVEAGYFFKVEYTIESAFIISGDVKFSGTSGFKVSANKSWTGIIGKLSGSVTEGGTFGIKSKGTKVTAENKAMEGTETVFVKPKSFGYFEFPSSAKPAEYIMSDDDMKGILKSMLQGDLIVGGRIDKENPRNEIKVTWEKKSGIWTNEYEYVGIDLLVLELYATIKINKKVIKDRKTIEGIAIKIRMDLEKLIIEEWNRTDYITHNDFNHYASTTLKIFLKSVESPI
jgi:hypothetical protein